MLDFDEYDLSERVPESSFRILFSKRIGSLRFIFWFLVAVMVATLTGFLLLWFIIGNSFFAKDQLGRELIGPMIALFGTGLAALLKLYDVIGQRLGAVDTLTHEVIGICRFIYTAQMLDALRSLYFLPSMAAFDSIQKLEHYTIYYDDHKKDLGFLGPNELNDIVTFYTMFKGSRETFEILKLWPVMDKTKSNYPENFIKIRKQLDVVAVIYCLFVAFESAWYIVGSLAENDRSRSKYQLFIFSLMCDCYIFLLEAIPKQDQRMNWLMNERRKDLMNPKNKKYLECQKHYEDLKRIVKWYSQQIPDTASS